MNLIGVYAIHFEGTAGSDPADAQGMREEVTVLVSMLPTRRTLPNERGSGDWKRTSATSALLPYAAQI
jgi:hypothetical protein